MYPGSNPETTWEGRQHLGASRWLAGFSPTGFWFILQKHFEQGVVAINAQIEKDLADGTIVIPDSTDADKSDIADAAAESLKPGS